MEPKGDKRRLAAIFAADMVGYSRLMEVDESGTLARLKSHRIELVDPAIAKNNGRIVKTTGDGMLVEFASVVDAVQCAAEIQRRMARRNADMPADRRIDFRIGINLGDIIVEDDDVFGSGVNIAARLEALAEPGGICISGTAYDNLTAKIDVGYEDLGAQEVKNITKPVHAYRVLLEPGDGSVAPSPTRPPAKRRQWIAATAAIVVVVLLVGGGGGYWTWDNWWRFQTVEAASLDRMAYPLPDKPSIAVLPFTNLSGDTSQEILADGLSEDIITALSKLPELFVISRNSTLPYKGEPVRVQQVAEDLGIRFVLQGSFQQAGDQLRVTAQLIDALSGEHLWADRFNRETTDFFAVRDEITWNVVSNVGAELAQGDWERILSRETDSLEAWLLYREAYTKALRITPEEVIPARALLEQAIAIDPGFVSAYATLGATYRFEGQYWPGDKSPEEYFQRASEYFDQGLALDPSHAYLHVVIAGLHIGRHDLDKAVETAEFAVARSPSLWVAHGLLGWALTLSLRPEDAIAEFQQAMRLSPAHPNWMIGELAHAYLLAGEVEQAQDTFRQLFERNPNRLSEALARSRYALLLADLGQEEEARQQVAIAVEIFPRISISYFAQSRPYKDPAVYEQFGAVWRRLGMPE